MADFRIVESRFAPSVDFTKNLFCSVSIMFHQELDSLGIDVVCARYEVFLCDVWHATGQALAVEIILGVMRLVLDHVERHHNILKARIFAVGSIIVNCFVAAVQTQVIVLLRHLFRCVFDLLKLSPIKCLLHCFYI